MRGGLTPSLIAKPIKIRQQCLRPKPQSRHFRDRAFSVISHQCLT
ncbi:hypothetical protein [Lusitaniella coriacea]|nr:hypothetical protein [Lusitaniella coriacea]